jgi:D-alanyl-D-alanine carboxypeptidase
VITAVDRMAGGSGAVSPGRSPPRAGQRLTTSLIDEWSLNMRESRPGRVAIALAAGLAAIPLAACGTEQSAARGNDVSRAGYDQAALRQDVEAIRAIGVTGVQARVTGPRGSGPAAAAGVSDISSRRPVSVEGSFRIGSANKAFVATVVLQLAGEGKLRLDDTVERWLPGLVRGNGHDGRTITVRQLLQHTSGVYDGNYARFASAEGYYRHRHDGKDPRRTVAAAMRHKPDFAPGTGWSYSNTGYVLLGMIVERATGRPWHAEVTGRIIGPLGLKHTSWPGRSPSLPRPHARGYDVFEEDGPKVDVTSLIDVDASGGLISTTSDMNIFFRALVGGRLLKPAQLAQMQGDPVPVSDQYQQVMPKARYGLGLIERPLSCGGVFWSHAGDQNGYSTANGVTADGRRSVTVSMSTQFFKPGDRALRQLKAASALVDHALCDGR